MRIAIVSDTFYPDINGISTSLLNHLSYLSKDNKIIVFTVEKKDSPKLDNIKFVYFKKFKFLKTIDLAVPNQKLFDKEFDNFEPDVLHIHTPSPLALAAIKKAKRSKVPIIATYHSILAEQLGYLPIPKAPKIPKLKSLSWRYTIKFYNSINLIIAPSNFVKKILVSKGVKTPIEIVSNGVDQKNFHKTVTEKYVIPTILFIGRLGYEKNIDVLIKAFKNVESNYKLLIIGDGPDYKKLKSLSEKLKLKNIIFKGFIKNDDLIEYYNKAHIFITLSKVETEGIVILEAMMCGLPIICINQGASKDIVKNNFNGFVVKDSLQDISNAINLLIKNNSLREKFSSNSIWLAKKYDVKNSINKLEKIYKRIRS